MAVALNNAQSNSVPIRALRHNAKEIICNLLNHPKIILSESGLQRDWRGLASLAGLTFSQTAALSNHENPTIKVLEMWYNEKKDDATLELFTRYLEEIDRFDVIDDIADLVEKDVKYFQETVCVNNNHCDNSYAFSEKYDAYVLYAEDDIAFATDLMEILERHHDLKLCTKERDLNGRVPFEYREIINLISECCNCLVLIFTPAFFKSSAIQFYYSFAQAMSIEQNKRKIIPCIYKPCEVPNELRYYTTIKYDSKLYNFWEKLRDSIRTPVHKPKNVCRSISMQPQVRQPAPPIPAANNESSLSVKERRQKVTFSSMQNLNQAEDGTVQEETSCNPPQGAISQNPSSVSLCEMADNSVNKKSKHQNKISTLVSKIFTPKNKDSKVKSSDSFRGKEKKHFWSKTKSKVAVAS